MFKDGIHIPDTFFRQYKEEINDKNRISLEKICTLGGVMVLALFILSMLLPVLEPTRYLYLYGVLVAVVTYVLNRKIPWTTPVFYFFFLCSYVFAIYLAVYAEGFQSTAAFCVFLVIMPTFIIDRQWHMHLFQTFVLCSYVGCLIQHFGVFEVPVYLVDGIAFYIFGLLIYNSRLVLQVRSIAVHDEMKQKVEVDALTNLFTRGALEQCIDDYIGESEETAAFILLDIDNFKGINDNFGHKVGDDLLHQTGGILMKEFRKSDYLGRLGGDEFVVFLPKLHNPSWLVSRLDRLVEEMNRTFIGDEAVCEVSASVGVAMYPKNGKTFDELYRNADHAMYESKKGGKNKYTIYEDE